MWSISNLIDILPTQKKNNNDKQINKNLLQNHKHKNTPRVFRDS